MLLPRICAFMPVEVRLCFLQSLIPFFFWTKIADLNALLGTPAARYIQSRPVAVNPNNDASIDQIQGWLKWCDTHHTCAHTDLPSLPTRVVDLTHNPTVVETRGQRGKYIALSYCWGTSRKNLLLTQSTLHAFQTKGVEMTQLPKTIQDAILVTKKLGVRYIWIDALCIIQQEPDLKDFKIEAPKMAEYYSNAYLTIAVGSASDCGDGFLNDRSPSEAAPCEIEYSRPNPLDRSQVNASGNIYLCLPSSEETGPIRTRAWTFQESELGRRVLTYRTEQYSFKCQREERFENGDLRTVECDLSKYLQMYSTEFIAPSLDAIIGSGHKDLVPNLYRRWEVSVGEYTARSMTNHSDKFAAIAGIAKHLQKVIGGKYLYGLWEGDLIAGLLWRTYSGSPHWRSASRDVYRAPSWSWASIDGRIDCVRRDVNQDKRIRDRRNWRVKIVSHNAIAGFLDPIRVEVAIPAAYELHIQGVLKSLRNLRDGGYELYDTSQIGQASLQRVGQSTSLCTCKFDVLADYSAIQVQAVELTTSEGLLLQHVDDKRYRRIGYFTVVFEVFERGRIQDIFLI